MTKDQKIEAVRATLVRTADLNGVVLLEYLNNKDDLNLLWHGATFRGLLQFIRLNEEVWGGYYIPSRKKIGDPRAFRDTDRQTHWTEPKYVLRSKKS